MDSNFQDCDQLLNFEYGVQSGNLINGNYNFENLFSQMIFVNFSKSFRIGLHLVCHSKR